MSEVKIGKSVIGKKYDVKFVAELGVNHLGNFERAIKMIDEAYESGADFLKFQTYKSELRYDKTKNPLANDFTKKVSEWEFDIKKEEELWNYAKDKGAQVFTTPYDAESLKFAEKMGSIAYKIAAYEINNHVLIEEICKTNKPIIISRGMCTLKEMDEVVNIFEKARVGDERALNALIIATQPDIRRYAKRSCSAADIDDAVQETLWVLSKRVGTVNMLASLPAWLFTVVRRECFRVAQRTMGDSLLKGADDIQGYEDNIQLSNKPTNELRVDLIRAMQSLPDYYRYVILLRDIEGMSIEEIANKLGRSRESIKAQLYRARLQVRDILL